MLQEELEHKAVAVSFKAVKLTATVLARALGAAANKIERSRNCPKSGDQSFKRLDRSISGDTADIEIVGRIKSFERYAKHYGVSYHVEKNKSTNPPKYTVFFKCNQAGRMTAAFKDYSAATLAEEKKPSVRQAIRDFREQVINAVREREPMHRERGERRGPER